MNKIAIYDSNFVVGLVDEDDKWHRTALELHSLIKTKNLLIVYFDCVANEVLSVIAKRFEEKRKSPEFTTKLNKFKEIFPKEDITWSYEKVEKYYEKILAIMKKSSGRLNFHDALICVVAEEMGIKYIVSFDKDFDTIKELTRIYDKQSLESLVHDRPDQPDRPNRPDRP